MLTEEEAITKSIELINRAKIALVGTIGDEGFPNIKAMIKAKHNQLKEIWFKTNTSSKRVSQIRRNNKTCVYFVDMDDWMGLMLIGKMEIKRDLALRKMLWKKGSERYYPLGVEDPDYIILHFIAETGDFYHNLQKITFPIPEK